MRRVIAIALAGASLGGCSSMSWDMFKSAPPTVQVRLESNPPGADARTSLGPGCKTPCSVSVPAPEAPFTVDYALNKYQPVSVPVNVIKNPGDFTTPRLGDHRSEPGVRGAPAGGAAEAGEEEAAPAEEAEAGRSRARRGAGRCCSARSRFCVPRSERGQALIYVYHPIVLCRVDA